MYRVVTKTLHWRDGQVRRKVDAGPWHPKEQPARTWADYLRSTGIYDTVLIESNGGSRHEGDDFLA